MDEDVLSGRALNEAVTFGSIEPLHCTPLSHNVLLSTVLVRTVPDTAAAGQRAYGRRALRKNKNPASHSHGGESNSGAVLMRIRQPQGNVCPASSPSSQEGRQRRQAGHHIQEHSRFATKNVHSHPP